MRQKTRQRIIAIIPARGGSKGIPKKNIIKFCGKPFLVWSIEQALNSKYIKEVYVSSEATEILNIAKAAGARTIRRPKNLATDASPSEDALLHAVSYIEKLNPAPIDIIVFLQATSPVRESRDITAAVRHFMARKADSLFSAAVRDDFCLWEIRDGKLDSVTYDYQKRMPRQERKPYYLENGSIFIFKPEVLKKYNNRLGGKIIFYPMPLWKSHQIDNKEDIEICAYYMRSRILKKGLSLLKLKSIKLIVYDFDGVFTDNKVTLSASGIESVVVNRQDGLAVAAFKKLKIPQIILTTEKNRVVQERAKKLGIPIIKGLSDKRKALAGYCRKRKLPLSDVVYVGNDINDLEAMRSVGYPVCPADAATEIKNISQIILAAKGGQGVIRELMNYIK